MFGNNPKPMASLSSSLLARKGHARPAMRPQGFVNLGPAAEDLGWNDMGGDESRAAPVAQAVPPQPAEPRDAADKPEVLRQRETLGEHYPAPSPEVSVAPPVPVEPVRLPTRPRARAPLAAGGRAKAAFTLRLDPERHLRLRLATAVCNRSAQQLVTEALDNFLETLPELDTLASHVPAKRA